MNERHDPKRFYHCSCREEGLGEHDNRFYHCDCLDGGYDPEAARVTALEKALQACVDAWDSNEGVVEACETARKLLQT